MFNRFTGSVSLLFVIGAVIACSGGGTEKLCTPGKSEACVGEGGCAGGQVCNEAGTAFGSCVCATSGTEDSGTQPVDSGTGNDAGNDAGEDAGVDGGNTGTCDPVAAPGQQGCGSGQKCTWIAVETMPTPFGKLGCVADGTVALGGTCTKGAVGETTGYDDCAAGGICINGTCRDICGFDPNTDPGCGPYAACTRYSDLFANGSDQPVAGACVETCDPITQTFADGGTCGAGKGCYLLTTQTETIAVCAGAGTVQHNQPINGSWFANSCVPGHQPRRVDQSSQQMECGALCAPADVTSTTNTQSESGVVPYNCEKQSASSPNPAAPPDDPDAGESCRYYWSREPFDPPSRYGNTVGWCFKHAKFQYDSDGDNSLDTPFPRCIDVTNGDVIPPVMNPPISDALYFWCVAVPTSTPLLGPVGRKPPTRVPVLLDRVTGW